MSIPQDNHTNVWQELLFSADWMKTDIPYAMPGWQLITTAVNYQQNYIAAIRFSNEKMQWLVQVKPPGYQYTQSYIIAHEHLNKFFYTAERMVDMLEHNFQLFKDAFEGKPVAKLVEKTAYDDYVSWSQQIKKIDYADIHLDHSYHSGVVIAKKDVHQYMAEYTVDNSFRTLSQQLPAMEEVVECPACMIDPSIEKYGLAKKEKLWSIVQHLNDQHRWTREAIADWIDLLPFNTEFTNPNLDKA